MRTSKLDLISASLFILLSASVGFTASTHAGDQPVEASQVQGKHLGVKLTGNPSALHKVLIGFKTAPGNAEEAIVHSMGGKTKYIYHLVPAIAATIPESAIEGLLRNPNVTHIDRDGTVRALDAELDAAWGVKRIGAGTVHDPPISNKGNGVKVAIIDSGIDYNHPDLYANYAGGKTTPKAASFATTLATTTTPWTIMGMGHMSRVPWLRWITASEW